MIQLRTVLKPADNSGAKRLRVILVHGGFKRRFGRVTDIVTCAVDQVDSRGQLRDGQVVKAVIVRTRKEIRRADGSYVKFDDNAAVVIDSLKNKNPVGTRIFGPIAKEVKDAGFTAIASMAKEIL
jgi:large subunit ribosomal protein L14